MAIETLLDRTYRLLDACDLTYREIAEGSGVDPNWLAKFKQRAIGEPGVSKVQNLHDFLRRGKRANIIPVSQKLARRAV